MRAPDGLTMLLTCEASGLVTIGVESPDLVIGGQGSVKEEVLPPLTIYRRKADLLESDPSCPDPIEGLVNGDAVREQGFLSQKECASDGVLSG